MPRIYDFLTMKYILINNKKNKTSQHHSSEHHSSNLEAIAVLAENPDKVTGNIQFTQNGENLEIKYDISGLSDGEHGFHIHEYGNLLDGCTTTGGHFNPLNKKHGGLNSKERHAGDLGNILSKNNRSSGIITTNTLSLHGNSQFSIIGRSILVHADRDDLGKGNNKDSLITGNAGRRLACGVIGIKN